MIFDKNKKNNKRRNKRIAKIKSVMAHLLLFLLIILGTFHTIFAFFFFSNLLCIFLLCAVLIVPPYLIEIYTNFRSGGLVRGICHLFSGYFSHNK